MALNIKDPETDRLARRLAETTGETITDALRIAIDERLRRVLRTQKPPARPALQRFIDRGRARPMLDARSMDEILGYDDTGLPR